MHYTNIKCKALLSYFLVSHIVLLKRWELIGKFIKYRFWILWWTTDAILAPTGSNTNLIQIESDRINRQKLAPSCSKLAVTKK